MALDTGLVIEGLDDVSICLGVRKPLRFSRMAL